ncbi:hypothetical protein SAMN05192574_102347 [Mucilaginibacter gossypiicola]|uniref:Uncharacterized protein n=1 Tax=Mucilaginibacter gossypiicola TaxID=551995 RepID=A0A1H8DJF4_9SPHI|nr:hypothetical protein [Mucilaginibacter gossypiicola]SEN06658.1 hypothetical protein SAMN05192574_102347 [Mucilaginibacter gossypiicola]
MSPFARFKKRTLDLLLPVVLLFVCLNASAQSAQVISIDSLSGKPSAGFPFDSPFELKYSLSGGVKASSAILFSVSSQGCLGNVLSQDCRESILKTQIDALKKKIAEEQDPLEKKKLKKLLAQQLSSTISVPLKINKQNGADVYVDMPALSPNRSYRVFIFANPVKVEGLEAILKKMDTDAVGAEADFNKLAVTYNTVIQVNPSKPCAGCQTITFQIGPFAAFQQDYTNKWKAPWTALVAERAALDKLKARFAGTAPSKTYDQKYDKIIKDFLAYAQECIKCDVKAPQYELLSKTKVDIPSVLINLHSSLLPTVYTGETDLALLNATVPNPDQAPEVTLQNLTNTILELQAIVALTDYFKYKYAYTNTDLAAFELFIKGAITDNEANLTALKAYQKAIADETAKVKKMEAAFTALTVPFFNQPVNNVGSNTWTYSFDTRATYMIRSDFGFMVYGNPWNNPGLKGFLPYVGFHVNLRPMNTDIPFSQIPDKDIFSYLSLNAGAVIGSLAQAGERDGLIGGTSIYTGLGVNFSHEVRLTFGGVWYRKYDPNPLINRKTAGVTPYLGLSIDFRLKDIYNGFKKIFEP